MPICTRVIFSTFAFCLSMAAAAPARAQEQQKDVILSVNGSTVRWAAVYKMQPERPDDPYFHIRVFERKKGWEPWRFNELVFHMTVTPQALEASRVDKRAKTFNYKDVELRGSYRRWLEDVSTRTKVPVCETNILDCIRNLPG